MLLCIPKVPWHLSLKNQKPNNIYKNYLSTTLFSEYGVAMPAQFTQYGFEQKVNKTKVKVTQGRLHKYMYRYMDDDDDNDESMKVDRQIDKQIN